MARMFTKELIELSIEACNSDAAHIERAKLLTGVVILRALDTPDSKDVEVSYTFDAGRCTEYKLDEQRAPSHLRNKKFRAMIDGLSCVTANYETWVKLDKGEIQPEDALNSPDYKVEGNMLMLMPLMQAVSSWTDKVRAVPKDY